MEAGGSVGLARVVIRAAALWRGAGDADSFFAPCE
jgi:hypothetical protein